MSSLQLAVLVKLPVFVVWLLYGRYLSRPYKLVVLQVVIALFTETTGRYIAVVLHQYNIWLFNIYWLVDFGLLCSAGYLLAQNKTQKKLIPYAAGVTIAVLIVTMLMQGIHLQPTLAASLMNIVLVYIYLGIMSATIHTRKLWMQSGFWLSISVISFSACTIPFYSIYNYLLANDLPALGRLFQIVTALNVIRYPLVAISLYLYGRQQLLSIKKADHVF
jgi:low affinity Fe/Cu permease